MPFLLNRFQSAYKLLDGTKLISRLPKTIQQIEIPTNILVRANSDFKINRHLDEDEEDENNEILLNEPNSFTLFCEPYKNRFLLPHMTGLAWQSPSTTVFSNLDLNVILDYENEYRQDNNKLKVAVNKCPILIKKDLCQIFPDPCIDFKNLNLTVINLKFYGDSEVGAKTFVLAAQEISKRLKKRFMFSWSDFINPFSGKPFFTNVADRKSYNSAKLSKALNMSISEHDTCTVINCGNQQCDFSGTIFTDAPISD